MSEELFVKCYVDEHISIIFVNVLRDKGIDVVTPLEAGSLKFSDEAHLQLAIDLERVFITSDRRTFLTKSKSAEKQHCGIVLIPGQISDLNAASAAEQLYDKYLNQYSKEEFRGLVVYL